ncbi:hypothetical protein RhiirA4_482983 [Rhizophagus irregularis]|uniref:Uncharacterized protein n=1 Tax=Rhizophagus irregularis TaxID=588596 RepID=A0A2I1HLV0_9GLOM|nr:hypothetical protein RhiirA4_482983 [Rhizophagus irregularis]
MQNNADVDCIMRDCLKEKSKKHSDINKHCDNQSMIRYLYKDCIKIIINEDLLLTDIKIHYVLHSIRIDVSISPELKLFISDNIDLLSRKIYKQLVEQLWNVLKNSQFKIHEIGVDATYNTNNLKFELYVIHVKIDGMGFLLVYLFMENNGNCGNGIPARFIWKNIKVQLYLWHIKKAVEARLSNNKKPIQINYNGEAAYKL